MRVPRQFATRRDCSGATAAHPLDSPPMRIIAGEFGGRKLLPPVGEVTRPITDRAKQSLFDIITPLHRGRARVRLLRRHRQHGPGMPLARGGVRHVLRGRPPGPDPADAEHHGRCSVQDRSRIDPGRPVQVVRADEHPPEHGRRNRRRPRLPRPALPLPDRAAGRTAAARAAPDARPPVARRDGRVPPRREERARPAEPASATTSASTATWRSSCCGQRPEHRNDRRRAANKPRRLARRRAGRRAPPARGGPRRVLRRRVRARPAAGAGAEGLRRRHRRPAGPRARAVPATRRRSAPRSA